MLSCIISIITMLQQLQWPNIGLSKKRLPPNWLVHHDFPFEHDHVFQVYRTPMFRRSLSHQKSPGPCCATEIHRPHPSLPSSAAGARPASKMLSSWDAKIWTKNWAVEPRWLFNQECGRSIFRHTMDVGPVLNVLIYPKLSDNPRHDLTPLHQGLPKHIVCSILIRCFNCNCPQIATKKSLWIAFCG